MAFHYDVGIRNITKRYFTAPWGKYPFYIAYTNVEEFVADDTYSLSSDARTFLYSSIQLPIIYDAVTDIFASIAYGDIDAEYDNVNFHVIKTVKNSATNISWSGQYVASGNIQNWSDGISGDFTGTLVFAPCVIFADLSGNFNFGAFTSWTDKTRYTIVSNVTATSFGFAVMTDPASLPSWSSFSFTFRTNQTSAVLGNSLLPLCWIGASQSEEEYDPYSNGGISEENIGGNGTFDDDSDTIEDSTLPTISAANTGFTRIYNPSLAQVQSLANYLWTDSTIIQTLWNHVKQFLENPMDAFIAFNLLPCSIPDGGLVEFKVMYIGTGVNITAAASQFVDVDCGNLTIDKYYDSALDYSPYTKISIYLPFIGSVQLDTDDVMGKTISVKYRIDIVSGGCVAKVFVDGSIHYQYSGHCAITIPFTSADFTGYISAMIQTAKSVTSIAAGAAGNTALAASMAGMPEQRTGKSTTTTTVSSRNPSTNRMRQVASTTVEKESVSGTEASFGSLLANNFNNTVGTVMGSKALVDRSGAFSGNTGYLGVRRPFVVIERPRMCNPADYGKYNGRPAMLTLTLGDCAGFTQVQQVQLTGFSATNPELDELGALLKSGVIL